MSRHTWSISHYETGAGGYWTEDAKIPRAGLDEFNRTEEATISFVDLVAGGKAKLTSETKSNLGTLTLVFPRQVVTGTVKAQFQDYIENERGIRIVVPVSSGASSYSSKTIEGYITKYQEDWVLGAGSTQEYIVRLDIQEFDID